MAIPPSKKNIFLLFICCCSLLLQAQEPAVDSLFLKHTQALAKAQEHGGLVKIAVAHADLASFCASTGVFSEAISQYNKALQYNGKVVLGAKEVQWLDQLGGVYLQLKNFKKAKEYFEQAKTLAIAQELGLELAKIKSNIGSCYEKQGAYIEALRLQKESLSWYHRTNDFLGQARANEHIGSIYEDLERLDKAKAYFEKAYDFFKGANAEFDLANVLNNIGDVHRKMGVYDSAFYYTRLSLGKAKKHKQYLKVASAYKDLAKTYALTGEGAKAYQMLKMANAVREEIISSDNITQITAIQTVYETQQKEQRIQILEQQNKRSQAQQKLLIVTIAAIVGMALVGFWSLRKKRKAHLKMQMYKQRTMQAELDKKAMEEQKLQQDVQYKTAALSRYSLHLAQKNKMLSDLSGRLTKMMQRSKIDLRSKMEEVVKEIEFDLAQEQEWDEFIGFFEELHPDFVSSLQKRTKEKLSPAELRLSILLRLNLSSKKIAAILRVTPDSVRVARYRLRKKLPIDSKADLVHFLTVV
ncbi:MAG: tetratricopeptide repeat protein [Flavobacteriaceae bacterium]|nr:tetratricopeptide repeat protein [Flavobacteriaceae bacterium]